MWLSNYSPSCSSWRTVAQTCQWARFIMIQPEPASKLPLRPEPCERGIRALSAPTYSEPGVSTCRGLRRVELKLQFKRWRHGDEASNQADDLDRLFGKL